MPRDLAKKSAGSLELFSLKCTLSYNSKPRGNFFYCHGFCYWPPKAKAKFLKKAVKNNERKTYPWVLRRGEDKWLALQFSFCGWQLFSNPSHSSWYERKLVLTNNIKVSKCVIRRRMSITHCSMIGEMRITQTRSHKCGAKDELRMKIQNVFRCLAFHTYNIVIYY